MAKYEFVSPYGVQFAGTGVRFVHDPELSTPNGEKRYRFSTGSASVAKTVRALQGFDIAELSETPTSEKDGR